MPKRADINVAAYPTAPNNRGTLFEIFAVILLFMAPTISDILCSVCWGSDYAAFTKQRSKADSTTATAYDMSSLEDIAPRLRFVPIVLYIIWRSGFGWSRFGFVKPQLVKDLLLGLLFWLVVAGAQTLLALDAHKRNLWWAFHFDALPAVRTLLICGNCLAIAFGEELVFRAYLIPRLEPLTKSTALAALCSVSVFGFAHIHFGPSAALRTALSALIWSVGFCVTRRIWPLVLSHALIDIAVMSHTAALTPA